MIKKYNHKQIEKRWQNFWKDKKIFKASENANKPKQYILDMFPYPSGAGLHVGHPKGYIATDVVSRMRMMQGYNVLHPMGWDAFGLPAENYAIKNKVHPSVATAKNVQTFKKQLGLLGFTYDWSREINTTDPNYYKWTQWIFLQMFKRGLAYESNEPINWCPSCKTGLANEDLEDGKCERCGSVVEQKPLRQWVLKITDYAERLLKDLDLLDKWPEPIKEMQRNWIGKSEGAIVRFSVIARSERSERRGDPGRDWIASSATPPRNDLDVFTTRPDTLFGATYVVVAPEHSLISNIQYQISNIKEVQEYIEKSKNKTTLERTDLAKEKTGVELKGIKAINPANNEELPIFVADYVLGNYGTGAIMAVPAHDERDFEFAKKYGLPIKEVVRPLATRVQGEDAFRHDVPANERKAVVCVVKHWSEDKYLGINWIRTAWRGFVIGGIKDSEEHATTGIREITEETGYKNIEFVGSLGGEVHARYFQLVKQENRVAHFFPLMFKLKDGERSEVEKKESDLHKLEWLSKEEMNRFVNYADMKIIWQRACGNFCFTADEKLIDDGVSVTGVLAESDFLNNLEVPEAKEKMIQWLEEKGLGKRQVQYKLRDWVFSRQRYWGEPIPLVHCEKCAGVAEVPSSVITFHAIGSFSQEHWHPWLDKELNKRGIKSITPDLPNSDKPVLKEWLAVAEKYYGEELNENSVMIGRSLGGRAILKFAENHKLKKLIVIAPTLDGGKKYWAEIAKQVPGFPVKEDEKCNAVPINYKKVAKNVKDIVFVFSHNDPYIRPEFEKHYRKAFPKAKFIVFEEAGHFGAKDGFAEFPELLDLVVGQKPKALIIHGFEGSEDSCWHKWMQIELEKNGFTVFNPTISDAAHPKLKFWMETLKPYFDQLGEKDIIIGHSMGAKAALHLVEIGKKKISALISVAGTINDLGEQKWKELKETLYLNSDLDALRQFCKEPVDLNLVAKFVQNVDLHISSDDTIVLQKNYQNLPANWLVKRWNGQGHFLQIQQEELLKEILKYKPNGWVPVSEDELPLELPKVKHYEPSGTGESPLANIDKWVNTKCPVCGGPAKRETNTMPQWAGSCWYYLRYCDPNNNKNLLNTGFVHKPAIEITEKDKLYFSVFKKVYTDLENKGIMTWAGNRLMLNGINHELWVPLRTVCLMVWEKDTAKAVEYLKEQNYSQIQDKGGNLLFERDGVKVEYIPVFKDKKGVYSLSYNKVRQPMEEEDFLENTIGQLWGFDYRVVSPEYNLRHLKYVQKHEPEHRVGVEDNERIEFLESWVKTTNKKILYWNPIDLYVGGAEHATRHLIYARFWHKFLYDIGAVGNPEPFTRLQNVGLILAEDGRKMSKRWGNVINPDDVVREYGADAMRLYEMFMGPFDQPCAWSMQGLVGMRRFLERVWNLNVRNTKTTKLRNAKLDSVLHQTIKKVTEDIEGLRFNTAISQLMTLVNEMTKDTEHVSCNTYQTLLQLLSPFAPHIAEELWSQLGNKISITKAEWPRYDPELAKEDKITIAVQINGKLRDTFEVPAEISEEEVKKMAMASEKVQKWLEDREPRKVIYVRGKLVSIVV